MQYFHQLLITVTSGTLPKMFVTDNNLENSKLSAQAFYSSVK